MITNNIGTSVYQHQFFARTRTSLAAYLGATERKTLSLQVLTRTEPVTRLAQGYQVSRKFLYQQAVKAEEALDRAFSPSPTDKSVIFHLPVTKDWIRQFVLSQVLTGHSSFRAVIEILNTLFDYRGISIGTVHNIVNSAVQKAKLINQAETLSAISIAAHDEIYQARKPVLVGMDVDSTYCYLLAAEDHCDETTWGVHLLDLSEQGLCLDYTIADGGNRLDIHSLYGFSRYILRLGCCQEFSHLFGCKRRFCSFSLIGIQHQRNEIISHLFAFFISKLQSRIT